MGKQVKQEKPWIRITEGRLYAYPVLRMMYRDVKAQDAYFYPLAATGYEPTGIHGKGQTSNPAYSNTIKKEALEIRRDDRFAKYLEETELISSIKELCNMQEKQFLQMRYFESHAMLSIMRQLNVSKNLYYKLRKNVVVRSAVVFGYLEYDDYVEMLA